MAKESLDNSVGKWVAGVLATVVAAVVIWMITSVLPAWLKSHDAAAAPDGTQSPSQGTSGQPSASGGTQDASKDLEVDGIVIDGITNKVIGGANVTLTIGQGSQQDVTTSFGSYSFLVKGADPGSLAKLAVAVSGYRNVTDQAAVGQWGIRESVMIPLNVAQAATPPSPQQGAAAPVGQPALNLKEPVRISPERFVRPSVSRVLTLKKTTPKP